jgi:queuine/archaeosine tRNA-ribosyltransferase
MLSIYSKTLLQESCSAYTVKHYYRYTVNTIKGIMLSTYSKTLFTGSMLSMYSKTLLQESCSAYTVKHYYRYTVKYYYRNHAQHIQ